MKLEKENTRQILKIVVIAIILLVALFNIKTVWNACLSFLDIISPFIWGLAIAFILNIFMTFYENKVFKLGKKNKTKANAKMQSAEASNVKVSNNTKRMSKKKSGIQRVFSIALSIITVIAIIAIILLLIVPQFIDVIRNLIGNIPNYLESLQELGIKITEQFPEANNFIQNIEIDTEALRNGIVNLSKNVLDITINQISSLISNIVNAFISIIFAVYILANKEELKNQSKKFIYARIDEGKADSIIKVCRLARDSFRNFITGQAKEAVILGSLCAIGMLILNIPYAGPIGALTAVTAFIPIVGAFIGGFIGAVLIVAVNPIKALIFIIFIIVLQQVEGNLIYPHVVGKNMGLPSIWVLVAITIGGGLFGIMGMIVGLPIVSIIYAITQENTNKKLREKNLEEEFEG